MHIDGKTRNANIDWQRFELFYPYLFCLVVFFSTWKQKSNYFICRYGVHEVCSSFNEFFFLFFCCFYHRLWCRFENKVSSIADMFSPDFGPSVDLNHSQDHTNFSKNLWNLRNRNIGLIIIWIDVTRKMRLPSFKHIKHNYLVEFVQSPK